MSTKLKVHVFTDCDLDGAGSYYALTTLKGERYPYTVTRVNDAYEKITGWMSVNNIDSYDRVYFLDLDLSQHVDLIPLIDRSNVTVIDHHKNHVESAELYTYADVKLTNDTSATKLVYKEYATDNNMSPEQKLLILMVDDYDSYKFKVPNSYNLNIVFWSYQGDRIEKFMNDFASGYNGFNQQQQNIINFNIKKLKNIITTLDVHQARVKIKGSERRLVSVFANQCINEIADHIIKNYKADIAFVVNLDSNKVSIRRDKSCKVDLNDLAQKLFDQGGGHEDAAGGILCDKFMTFAKLFKPHKIHNFNG